MQQLAHRVNETPLSATVHLADLAAEMRRNGREVLDFSAGRASEASPHYVNRVAAAAILSGDIHQTMAQGKPEFREMVARKLARENEISVDPDKHVMATLGCKNGLTLALLAAINPGDEVIVEDPCFVSYPATVGVCGGKTVAVPLRPESGFRWSGADLEAAITSRTRCILFCSPQNPTGTVHMEEDLDVISEVAIKHDLLVIVDEIYERVTWGGRRHLCLATRPQMQDRTVGLMGFTKTLSMGGWRIGFAYGSEVIIAAMVTFQQHLMTSAGSFTQTGAAAALAEEYRPEVRQMWQDWEKRCAFVATEINRIPKLSCKVPEGGFYAWINMQETQETSALFTERLLREKQMVLVPGAAFGVCGEGYVRMTSVKSWEDLRTGIARLKEWLG